MGKISQKTEYLSCSTYLKFIIISFKKKVDSSYLHFMHLFSTDATISFLILIFFTHKNIKNPPQKFLIISPFFISVFQTAKNQPNLCFMKIAHRETYAHIMTLVLMQMWSPWSICQILKKFFPFLARLEQL